MLALLVTATWASAVENTEQQLCTMAVTESQIDGKLAAKHSASKGVCKFNDALMHVMYDTERIVAASELLSSCQVL